MGNYTPPFEITTEIITLVEEIGEALGSFVVSGSASLPYLRRINRVKTVQATCAIEGNTLEEAQVTALLDGKRVIGVPREIQEIQNALDVYDRIESINSDSLTELLNTHKVLMKGLIGSPGMFRTGGAGIQKGEDIIHLAPPASQVSKLMSDLFHWLNESEDHPLIRSSIFHYEFEFIHPFEDGNGRMGRYWQSLILSEWKPLFSMVPIESLIKVHQDEYYAALNESTGSGSSTPFVTFMLKVILEALKESGQSTPYVTPQVTPQVNQLLLLLENGALSLWEIAQALGLSDRKNVMKRWIVPALEAGVVERTIPDKPRSRNQKYRKRRQ